MMGIFVLGLMAKPMLVTLPCVLMLLDYWPLGRLGKDPGSFGNAYPGWHLIPTTVRRRKTLIGFCPGNEYSYLLSSTP